MRLALVLDVLPAALVRARRVYLICALACVGYFYLWNAARWGRGVGIVIAICGMPWSALLLTPRPDLLSNLGWPMRLVLDAAFLTAAFSINATLAFMLGPTFAKRLPAG